MPHHRVILPSAEIFTLHRKEETMKAWRRNCLTFRILSVVAVLSLTAPSYADLTAAPRILPQGKVSVFDGDQKIGELTAEAPFPMGKVLEVEGTCGAKMGTYYLVAEDGSRFVVTQEKSKHFLFVKKGRGHFGITSLPEALVLVTPNGALTAQQAILNADSDGILKGYVDVAEDEVSVGVVGGGSLVFTTAEGEKALSQGNSFILAQQLTDGSGPGLQFGLAVGMTAGIAGIAAVQQSQGGGEGSPFMPPTTP
jgi:hypothetical protein